MSSLGPSDWMKKATILGYARISDAKQDTASRKEKDPLKKPVLIAQMDEVNKSLKNLKLPKVKEWFAEVRSGTERDRPKWIEVQGRAQELAAEGKRVLIVVKEPARWARNARHAFSAFDVLHEKGIPVLAAREGIQTGSKGDLHPTEELLFVQLGGSSAFVSQEQKKKADTSVEVAKEAGVTSGKGTTLYPFAAEDPLDVYVENIHRVSKKKKDGGWSKQSFRDYVADTTSPHGPAATAVVGVGNKEIERRKKLNAEEYQAWYDYRKKIRNLLIEAEHDPLARATKSGDINWSVRALMRMVGRYLDEPWKYIQRSDEEIQEILSDYPKYLSGKDVEKHNVIVGHRRKK